MVETQVKKTSLGAARAVSRIVHPSRRVAASQEPIAAGLIEFLGGPVGSHARVGRASWWTPLRVLTALAWTFMGLAYLAKANCAGGVRGTDGVLSLDWAGNRHFTSACYSDIVPLYDGRGLGQGSFPYAFSWVENGANRYMEYPVLAGMFQGLIGEIAHATHGLVDWLDVPEAGWYFALTALVMAVMWVATVLMVAELAGNRIWDTVLVAASPLVIMHAFTNWDIPSITFVVAALLLVKRHRPGWAGVMLGWGTAFKLWPVFVLGAFLVLAIRNRRWAPFVRMVAAAAAAWIVVNVPVAIAYPQAWGEFFRLNSERSWEWTTVYAVLGRNAGFTMEPGTLNVLAFSAFILLCLVIGTFALRAKRTPRVAEIVYLTVAAFLLVNKVWSPQYSLWLLVPAVLALPNWRLILSWATADALVWPILMWHMMGESNKGAPGELLDLFILTRDGLIIAIAVLIVRQMLGRRPDKVSLAHDGIDILAGPFAKQQKQEQQ